MLGDALLVRYEVFGSTAVVAAHASARGEGFRQRDVKFFIELFSNWVERDLPERALPVQNTQVQRYIESLVEDGYVRKLTRNARPLYRLTRIGLLELVTRSVQPKVMLSKEQFFFLHYYIRHYRPLIEMLIKAEGKQFPYSFKLELDQLFDAQTLLEREITRASQELKRLERRISDSVARAKLAENLKKSGASQSDIIHEIEDLYPYELNSQKPLSELIDNIPEPMRMWELSTGNLSRATEMWGPIREGLKTYLAELRTLAASPNASAGRDK